MSNPLIRLETEGPVAAVKVGQPDSLSVGRPAVDKTLDAVLDEVDVEVDQQAYWKIQQSQVSVRLHEVEGNEVNHGFYFDKYTPLHW